MPKGIYERKLSIKQKLSEKMTERLMEWWQNPEYIKKQRERNLGKKNPSWKHGRFEGKSGGYIKKGWNPKSGNHGFKKGTTIGIATRFKKDDKRLVGIPQSKEHIEKRTSQIRKKAKVKCDYCGKEIERVPYEIKHRKHHFCNRKHYGKWFSQARGKLFEWNISKEGKERIRNSRLGNKNPRHKTWQKLSEKEKQNWIEEMRNRSSKRPTVPELKMIDIIKKYNLPYRYVGDGQFWIRKYNPDFINVNGEKKVIEVFGDYWHKDDNGKREKIFKEFGYKCIVIWEHELNELSDKDIVIKIERRNCHVSPDKRALLSSTKS